METKVNFIKALSNDMPNYFANNCDMYNLIGCAGYTKPLTAEQADNISALLAFAYDDYKAQLEHDDDDDAAFFEIQDNAAAEIANYLYVDNITVEPKLAAFLQAKGVYDDFVERTKKSWGNAVVTINSIAEAFIWDDSEIALWAALDDKWCKLNEK